MSTDLYPEQQRRRTVSERVNHDFACSVRCREWRTRRSNVGARERQLPTCDLTVMSTDRIRAKVCTLSVVPTSLLHGSYSLYLLGPFDLQTYHIWKHCRHSDS